MATTAAMIRKVIALGPWVTALVLASARGTDESSANAAPAEPLPASIELPIIAPPPATPPPIGLPVDAHLDTAPPRRTVGLELLKNGWTYNCMACHKLIRAKWHYDRPMAEHREIKLAHGNNRFCLNCHHPANRNAFVDYDGAEITQADVVQLCAKCHGTIFRDWRAGVHGRANGFWSADLGPKTKLRCIQCHDPHRPKFPAMPPLAPWRYPRRAAHPPAEEPGPAGSAGP